MGVTSNYSFPVPVATDLVKDGWDAINDLGVAVDTAMNTALGTKKAMGVLLSTVTFSGVTSISLNNVFSATYDNYKIYLNITSFTASPSITIRMRASGTDNSSSNYRYSGVRVDAANASVAGINSGASTTSFALIGSGTGGTSIFASLEFLQPFATARTSYSTNAFPQGGFGYQGNGRMTVDTSYDGLSFISDDNNIAGNINVYGLAK